MKEYYDDINMYCHGAERIINSLKYTHTLSNDIELLCTFRRQLTPKDKNIIKDEVLDQLDLFSLSNSEKADDYSVGTFRSNLLSESEL
jgi:hypothetical protein